MIARIANVSIHAEEPTELARFWSAVAQYPEPTGWPPEQLAALREAGLDDIAT